MVSYESVAKGLLQTILNDRQEKIEAIERKRKEKKKEWYEKSMKDPEWRARKNARGKVYANSEKGRQVQIKYRQEHQEELNEYKRNWNKKKQSKN